MRHNQRNPLDYKGLQLRTAAQIQPEVRNDFANYVEVTKIAIAACRKTSKRQRSGHIGAQEPPIGG